MGIEALNSAVAGQTQKVQGNAEAAARERQEAQRNSQSTARQPAGRRVEDRVDISPQGRLTAEVLSSLAAYDSPEVLEAKTAAFQRELGDRLQAAGIDSSYPVELTTDSSGRVRVANDHPDKNKIEALLEADPGLSAEFRHISASASLQKAIDAHSEFTKAYGQNPAAAVASFAHLFSGEIREFSLIVGK